MVRSLVYAIALALVFGSLNAQRNKLYKDFDSFDTSDRFNLLSKQGGIAYRLPNETRPIRYDISLRTWIDEGRFDFEGYVRIHLRVDNETDHIVVHSKQLVVSDVTLLDSSETTLSIVPHVLDPVTEFLTVKLTSGMLAENSEYTLHINYTGTLRTDDQGFYRSSYLNPQNQVVVLLYLAISANGQRSKLYRDFDPTIDRFSNVNRQGVAYRLPNDTIPIRYDIELTTRIDLNNFFFNGNVAIRLLVQQSTNKITIHSKQLTISSVALRSASGFPLPVTFQLDPVTEFLTVTLQLGNFALNQEYILTVVYYGELRRDDQGFYRSSYVNAQGETVWLATTQFEQTEARHAFPCYDEPGIRAVYGLTITHGSRYHALANMPIKSKSEPTPGVTVTVFEDTPIMQSYLNAFVVSDFKNITNEDTRLEGETLQRVFGVPSVIDAGEAEFALEAGVKILKGLEKHLNYSYPLPKLDQIGIPDFYWGAMENWGLVTYRESALYYNPTTSPMTQLDQVSGIVGHEYAHQWFGNIISPTWWEYIWLNEGFATLFEYISVDLVYPEFRVNEFMLTATCQPVFDRDAYETTRPMNYYVEDPVSVQNLFDFVAYSKSGCVLRMLRHVLTPATFTKGLTTYLHEMEYKSATPDDLYRNLDAAARADGSMPSDVTVKTIMDSWASQKGFPMVTVRRDDEGNITLTQERFLLERLPTSQAQRWWVPYNFVTKNSADFSNTAPDAWIPQSETTVKVLPKGSQTWTNDDWIVLNKQASSYYRVNYDERLWDLITEELVNGDYTKIHLLNRAQLIDDAYAFARTKTIDYDVVFGLLEYLSNELDYIPWVPANRVFTLVDRVMASLDNYGHLKMFIQQAVQPIFEKLGVANMDNDSLFDRMARVIAVRWACYVGSEECQKAAIDRVKDYIATDRMIEADNRNTVLCAGMRGAEESVFLDLWRKMTTSTDAGTRNMLIDALACSQNEDLLKVLLGTVIDTTVYTVAERTRIMSAVANSGVIGAKMVTAFLDENLAATVGRVSSLVTTINNVGNWISTEDYLNKFTGVLDKMQSAGAITPAQSTAAQTLTRNNIQWVRDFGPSVSAFLDDYRQRNSGVVKTISTLLLLATATLSTLNLLR